MTDVKKSVGTSKSKIAIIILLTLILVLTAAILFFVISDNQVDIMQVFQTNGEYTIPLEEFLVNLKSTGNTKHFLKVTIALMYTDEKQGEVIEASVNKIRDAIISGIRSKSYEDILNDEGTMQLKGEVIKNINTVLDGDIIKAIYITDIIVQ